jgi:hypothetical protein
MIEPFIDFALRKLAFVGADRCVCPALLFDCRRTLRFATTPFRDEKESATATIQNSRQMYLLLFKAVSISALARLQIALCSVGLQF